MNLSCTVNMKKDYGKGCMMLIYNWRGGERVIKIINIIVVVGHEQGRFEKLYILLISSIPSLRMALSRVWQDTLMIWEENTAFLLSFNSLLDPSGQGLELRRYSRKIAHIDKKVRHLDVGFSPFEVVICLIRGHQLIIMIRLFAH